MSERSFEIAPMSPLIRGLTIFLLLLPVVFVAIGALGGGPAGVVLLATGALIALLYASIWWGGRPSRFLVTDAALTIVWPVRRAVVPRHDVAGARVMTLREFRDEYGNTVRVGAGGLFGTFGWLWSRRGGWLDVYVTNLGDWVVVERRSGRPLVLSPADPEGFAAALASP